MCNTTRKSKSTCRNSNINIYVRDGCEGAEGAEGFVHALGGVVDVGDASAAAVALQADGGPVHPDPFRILRFGYFGGIVLGLGEVAVAAAVAVAVFAPMMWPNPGSTVRVTATALPGDSVGIATALEGHSLRVFPRHLAVAIDAHDVGAHVAALIVVVSWSRSTPGREGGGGPAAVIVGIGIGLAVRLLLVQDGPGGGASRRSTAILEGLAVHHTLERSLLLNARQPVVAAGDAAAADARDVSERLAAARARGGRRERSAGTQEEEKKGGGSSGSHCHRVLL